MTGIDRRTAVGAGIFMLLGGVTEAALSAADAYDDPDLMYRALHDQPGTDLHIGGAVLHVVFADGGAGLDRARVLAWVQRSASAVTTYFGRFAVAHYDLLIVTGEGNKVGHATTFGYRGAATRVHVGANADQDAFTRDWVLVHEMVHTALPNLPRNALWLQEGNATYIEPIAQAQAGHLPIAGVWIQSLVGMPKGQPQPAAGGMDGTHAWGRLYWGGATFWLLAEVAIYEESKGRSTLRDAMRAINRQSGGIGVDWQPDQLMAVGDTATGTGALRRLYTQFANDRVETDLSALFARLGIGRASDGVISFDDRAPLAALRKIITRA
jgi:hypothetical protein